MTKKEFNQTFGKLVKHIDKVNGYFEQKVVVEYNINGYAEAEGFDPYNVTVKYFEDDEEMGDYEVYAFESASPAKTFKYAKEVEAQFKKFVETEYVKQVLN